MGQEAAGPGDVDDGELELVLAERVAGLRVFAESLPPVLRPRVSPRCVAALFGIGGRHQAGLEVLLGELEGLGAAEADGHGFAQGFGLPGEAVMLHGAVSRFLAAYGRRDEVDGAASIQGSAAGASS